MRIFLSKKIVNYFVQCMFFVWKEKYEIFKKKNLRQLGYYQQSQEKEALDSDNRKQQASSESSTLTNRPHLFPIEHPTARIKI